MTQRTYHLPNGTEIIVSDKPETERVAFSFLSKDDCMYFMLPLQRGQMLESIFSDLSVKKVKDGAHRRH